MSDIGDIKYLEQPATVGTLRLSEAIRKGKPLVDESADEFRFCAIGCAFAGVKGRPMTVFEQREFNQIHLGLSGVARAIGKHLGLSEDACERANHLHFHEDMPALLIADILESEGH